jgi:hypothetical protein
MSIDLFAEDCNGFRITDAELVQAPRELLCRSNGQRPLR